MKKILAIAALCTPLCGQVSGCTSPIGYNVADGGYRSAFLGVFVKKGRLQSIERSKGFQDAAFTATQIDYRSSTSWTYTKTNGGIGRTFSKFTLSLGPAASNTSLTFAKNFKSGSTLVFSGKLSFPTLNGRPTQTWGNAGSVVFSTTYAKRKGDDIVLDYTMENGAHSDGSTPPGNGISPYQMDGLASRTFGYHPGTFVPTTRNACGDTGYAPGTGAYLAASAFAYADNYSIATLAGKLQLSRSSYYTARNGAAVIHAASLSGTDQGVSIPGFSCNRLHLDLSLLLGLEIATVGRSAVGLYSKVDLVTADNTWAGAPVYLQAAWTDSLTKEPKLTQATRLSVPVKPEPYTKGIVFEYWNLAGNAKTGPSALASVTGPVPRFRKK